MELLAPVAIVNIATVKKVIIKSGGMRYCVHSWCDKDRKLMDSCDCDKEFRTYLKKKAKERKENENKYHP